MANWFAITATTNAITLDAARSAIASFAVANESGGSIRGAARVVLVGTGSPDWFAIETPTRTYAADHTEQIVVTVTVPPDATPGQVQFRLRMVLVDGAPEEQFDDGPVVVFEVPVPPPPAAATPPRKRRWWPIVAAIVVALLAVAGIAWYLLPVVPSVTGLTGAQAATAIQQARLEPIASSAYSDSVASGIVVSSSPAPGGKVMFGSAVAYVVSLGQRLVPDVTGKPADEAQSTIEEIGLVAVREDHPDAAVPAGTVIGTTPPAGTPVAADASVVLRVSAGPLTVPGVVGSKAVDAPSAILNAHLIPQGVDRCLESGVCLTGLFVQYCVVDQQDPQPGTPAGEGQVVRYWYRDDGSCGFLRIDPNLIQRFNP